MSPKLPLVASALVLTVYGVAFVLAPASVLQVYAVQLPKAGLVITQLFGAAMLGFGFTNWLLGRGAPDRALGRPVFLGNVLHFAVGFVALLAGHLAGVANQLVWFNIALYFAFAVVFGLVLFAKPRVPA